MIVLKRVKTWRAEFARAIDEIKRRPFDWSTQHDCGLGLAAHVVKAITGHDFAEPYRGRYYTAEGAYRLMKEEGFDNLADMVASMVPEIKPIRCVVGDILAFQDDESVVGYALGVSNGDGGAIVLRAEGMGRMDILQAKRAFKVG
jgi:hypothetical protein